MATSKKNQYDSVVVGSGLTGLIIAHELSQAGQRVALFEAHDHAGGNLHTVKNHETSFRSCLEFLPDNAAHTEALEKLSQMINTKILGPSFEQTPRTFDKGELKEFLGFGDQKFAAIDEATWYSQKKVRQIVSRPDEWVASLLEDPAFDIFTLHEVTRFTVEENKIVNIKVNGAKTFSSENYIFAAPVSHLADLLPLDAMTHKERNKLSKATGWTTVTLHLKHQGIQTELQDMHILMGSKTDVEPCVGKFFPATNDEESSEVLQESQWISFIHNDFAEDMDFVGAILKNIKKQLKRAYPEAFEAISSEKIVVAPNASGFENLALKNPHRLSKIENFWIASQLMTEQRNFGSAAQIAFETLDLITPEVDEQLEVLPIVEVKVSSSKAEIDIHN